ncbi:MAG: hypothetical protein WBD00_02195 [Candidatus Omnitrophota bacterium]|jgi:hypothetical protein
MSNRKTRFLIIGALIFSALIVFSTQSFAQYEQGEKLKIDFTKLEILVYPSGLTGFFDRETGKLYIYDTRSVDCIMIRQMTKPGKAMKVIKG